MAGRRPCAFWPKRAGFLGLAGRAARRAASGESQYRSRSNHFMLACGCRRWSWRSVGRSSAASPARNAVGTASITMTQYLKRGTFR